MKILLLILGLMPFYPNIYDLKVASIDGGTIDFAAFKGKKILLVNIATNSAYADQLGQLEDLHDRYKDKLVIVAFPSNSMNNEPRDDKEILEYVKNYYNVHYLIAAKMETKGARKSRFYKWITSKEDNGVTASEIKNDYQKYLIDTDGSLMGIFSSAVDPTSPELINAIEGKF